ncbi:venom serine carboxypeptidase [Lepeophtheirus salmonis]|uniref:venom serine carboxypeptidase n=1 Tax=Lepeophtheirus salmonis TaxID=72036 RepID=UPI001AEA32B2|nr:venom serine carboxypeptidase-like [Lepeophtheirus salmonis]
MCFKVCQPRDFNYKRNRDIHSYIDGDDSGEKKFYLFQFPDEPEFDENEVGKPLIITDYIRRNQTAEGASESLVYGVGPDDEDDLVSYSGFLRIDDILDSNLFFWFFPSCHPHPGSRPLIIWLQGGPGTTSLYGLFKEIGPFLSKSRTIPSTEPFLTLNPFSWHKEANILFIDNPIGTGFSFTKNVTSGYHIKQKSIAIDLGNFLEQFALLYPHYLPDWSDEFPIQLYLFGESYGGTHVISLAKHILENPIVNMNLTGVGIGNGWISPSNHVSYSDFLKNLGLIKKQTYQILHRNEKIVLDLIEQGKFKRANDHRQNVLTDILALLSYTNAYDITKSQSDLTMWDFWPYIQKPIVRKALHVGNLHFSDGLRVIHELGSSIMMDQIDALGIVLNSGVDVLIYHGMFDLILPLSGVSQALENTLEWKGKKSWLTAPRKSYWYRVSETSESQLLGYIQKAAGLSFVIVRNCGHMVPIDQPAWMFQILKDFLTKK